MNPLPEKRVSSAAASWLKRMLYGVWILGLLFFLAVISSPLWLRSRKNTNRTEAVSNARQIGVALLEFERRHGSFPAIGTIEKSRNKSGAEMKSVAKSSNDFFRQLIASEICQSEAIFYALTSTTHRPDNVFSGTKALEKGECGFTYFPGATMDGDPSRPLAISPMIPGTDRFDPKPFKGKAVVLRLDGSVQSIPILKDGHAWLNGKNIMDPANPIWGGEIPSIAWPE